MLHKIAIAFDLLSGRLDPYGESIIFIRAMVAAILSNAKLMSHVHTMESMVVVGTASSTYRRGVRFLA